MKAIGFIAICIVLIALGSAGPPRRHTKSTRPKVQLVDPDTVDNVADETLSLITTGKDKIILADNLKEVVLVVGNTGVGKTTLSKFITGQKLLAYKSGSRYLIKDVDGKISTNSTLISKTIYPDVFQDEAGTVYYDLPGFSDTRNASIELANSWFMKMVADHVDRVKILCIVNFSSLKTGESRVDFKSFLEHIIKFVVDPEKFKSSIALLASKVEHNLEDDEAVSGIVEFLTQANNDIQGLFIDDDEKLDKAAEIIKAFLHKSAGKYDRIGFFKQPGQEGEFDNITYFVKRRAALRGMVDNSLKFTSKRKEDFGISVTESAVLYVRKVLERLNMRFSTVMESLAGKLGEEFLLQNTAQNTSGQVTNPGVLLSRIAKLERMERQLRNSTSRPAFIRTLADEVRGIASMNATMKELTLLDQTVSFYEGIDNRRVPPQPTQWAQPLKALVTQLHSQVQIVIQALNTHTEQEIQKLSNSIKTGFIAELNDAESKSHEDQIALAEIAQKDYRVLQDLRNLLSNDQSFNGVIQNIKSSVARLSFQSVLPPFNVNLLPQDLQVNSMLHLKIESWLRRFLELNEVISQELAEFKRKIQDHKHRIHVQALNNSFTSLQEEHQQTAKATQNKIAKFQDDLRKEREAQAKKQAELDSVRQDVAKMQTSLTAAQQQAAQADLDRKNAEAEANRVENAKLQAMVMDTQKALEDTRREIEAKKVQDAHDRVVQQLEDRLRETEAARWRDQYNNNNKPKKIGGVLGFFKNIFVGDI